MLRKSLDLEKYEARQLAVYAQRSSQSRGRMYDEPLHPFRTAFQRDRDRIVHSKLFRRLEYKTQVFLNGSGDNYRTRMTHTIEVSCIARTMARTMGLNEDLAECIALAHDLGHPPFGHLGEETLNELMADFGGFDHNQQSLRVVTELELKYPEFNGLNLSWEIREGLRKPFKPDATFPTFIQPSLEAQIVDVGDQVAYICHDLDDGFDSGLIHETDLADLPLWRETSEIALASYPNLEAERARNYVLRCLLGRLVEDVVTYSDANVEATAPDSADAVRALPRQVGFSPQFKPQAKELLTFLYSRLYHHPTLREINLRSVDCLQQLFRLLVGHPHLLSPRFEVRIKKNGVHRAICDYLACQTDRQIYILFKRFIGDPASSDVNRLEQAILF